MENTRKTLFIYKEKNNREPYKEWIASIKDKKVLAIIQQRLDRLELGLCGDCKSVGNGIQELRIHYGAGYRVYFTEINKVIVILLCGGNKNTQAKDIECAKNYLNELRSRENG